MTAVKFKANQRVYLTQDTDLLSIYTQSNGSRTVAERGRRGEFVTFSHYGYGSGRRLAYVSQVGQNRYRAGGHARMVAIDHLSAEAPAAANSILDTAKELIHGDRAKAYGPFGHNAQQQADLWNAYLRQPDGSIRAIEPMDVPMMMVLVKAMRLSGNNTHQDSWVDVAGFAGLAEQVHDQTVPPKPIMGTLRKEDIKRGLRVRVLREESVDYAGDPHRIKPGEYTTAGVSALTWKRDGEVVPFVWLSGKHGAALDNLELIEEPKPIARGARVRVTSGPVEIRSHGGSGDLRRVEAGWTGVVSHASDLNNWVGAGGSKVNSKVWYVDFGGGKGRQPVPDTWLKRID